MPVTLPCSCPSVLPSFPQKSAIPLTSTQNDVPPAKRKLNCISSIKLASCPETKHATLTMCCKKIQGVSVGNYGKTSHDPLFECHGPHCWFSVTAKSLPSSTVPVQPGNQLMNFMSR